jgi:hypothetical protein
MDLSSFFVLEFSIIIFWEFLNAFRVWSDCTGLQAGLALCVASANHFWSKQSKVNLTHLVSLKIEFFEDSLPCCCIFQVLKIELKLVLGGMRDVALFRYPSCTDSNKPSLQFSCNFNVIDASEGLPFFSRFFYYY